MTKYYLYILRCSDNSLYTGITTDTDRRVREHNEGKGSKYTYSRRPVELIYVHECNGRSEASKEEARIKKLSRLQKIALASPPILT